MATGTVKKRIEIRQIQFNLPNSVTLTKGSGTAVLSDYDLANANPSGMILDSIPVGMTLVAASPLWSNNFTSSGLIFDCLVQNGKLTVAGGVMYTNTATITAIRLLTVWA